MAPLFVSAPCPHLLIRSQGQTGPAAHTAAQCCLERKRYVESNCTDSCRLCGDDGRLGDDGGDLCGGRCLGGPKPASSDMAGLFRSRHRALRSSPRTGSATHRTREMRGIAGPFISAPFKFLQAAQIDRETGTRLQCYYPYRACETPGTCAATPAFNGPRADDTLVFRGDRIHGADGTPGVDWK